MSGDIVAHDAGGEVSLHIDDMIDGQLARCGLNKSQARRLRDWLTRWLDSRPAKEAKR